MSVEKIFHDCNKFHSIHLYYTTYVQYICLFKHILQLATLSNNCSLKLRNKTAMLHWNLLKVQSRRLSPLCACCNFPTPVSLRSTSSFSSSQTDTLYSASVANHLYATKCSKKHVCCLSAVKSDRQSLPSPFITTTKTLVQTLKGASYKESPNSSDCSYGDLLHYYVHTQFLILLFSFLLW